MLLYLKNNSQKQHTEPQMLVFHFGWTNNKKTRKKKKSREKMVRKKSNEEEKESSAPMSNLPEVIIVEEILSRLPVKPLLRFTSVCKSWNSLITSDSQFAQLQLKNSQKTTSDSDRQRVLLWDSSSTFFLEKNPSTDSLFAVGKLSCPIKDSSLSIVASCDGLVCVREHKNNAILFWNALTGERKRVLEPPSESPSPCFTYGLGYDSSTDDYKLVRVFRFDIEKPNRIYSKEVRVYSLRTDSWRRIPDFPFPICKLDDKGVVGVSLKGVLYWTVYQKNSPDAWFKILSFDLGKEEYNLLEVCDRSRLLYSYIRVATLDGKKLCAYYPLLDGETYDLWLIDEYDNCESWTKYTIALPGGGPPPTPLCLLKNGEEVLAAVGGEKLGVYHLKDHTFRDLQIPTVLENFQTITFLETLISPNKYEGY